MAQMLRAAKVIATNGTIESFIKAPCEMYKCKDVNLLLARFRRFMMPKEARTDMTKVDKKPYLAIKKYAQVFPPAQEILEAIQAPQDDPEKFKKSRQGSMGASGAAVPMGYSKYADNIAMMRLEAGFELVHPSSFYSDYENFDHGHYVESEGADMYQILMGCAVYKAGTFKHWKFPWLHVSPDRCSIYPEGVLHNIYAKNDSPRGGCELKGPNELYVIKLPNGSRLMIVPAEYMIQLQLQMRNQCWDWVDFTVHKKPRFDRPIGSMGAIKKIGEGRYLVSETTVCRVYRNNKFADLIPQYVSSYIHSVRSRVEPSIRRSGTNGNNVELPPCVQLPLKWTQKILTTPDGEHDMPLKDGVLNGVIEEKITEYERSPPILVPMSVMLNYKTSKGENIQILKEVPPPDPHPTLKDVLNPLYRERMIADPSKTLSDVIWDLTLENFHFHREEDDLTPLPATSGA